jgi:NAD(P)H-hydrate epimerase
MGDYRKSLRCAYTSAAVRQLDEVAINRYEIPGIVLMRRAGAATLAAILDRWPSTESVTVLCGAGNNAGDGYIVAGLASQKGIAAEVKWLISPSKLKGDARLAWQWAEEQGVRIGGYADSPALSGEVLVDALLGTGLQGSVRESYREPILAINNSSKPVVAVDIPSGLNADTGIAMGACVTADLTVTFIGLKCGLFTGDGTRYTGDVQFENLSVPESAYSGVESAADIMNIEELLQLLPPRHKNAHKGNFGHLLLVGGDRGMPGSIAMAAIAAARTGAGLTSVATHQEHVAPLITMQPEIMVNGIDSGQAFEPLLDREASRYSALVIGPGLGQSAWSEQMLQLVLNSGLPLVVDADGLNLIAGKPVSQREDWVLTPHPGEAGRLLACTTEEVQQNRFDAVKAIQERYGGVVLLKGAGTLICDGETISICPYGNPGMSTGGMGDVLTGVIGGLICQGLSLLHATQLGACLHAKAADLVASRTGEVGLLATDLFTDLRRLINSRSLDGAAQRE